MDSTRMFYRLFMLVLFFCCLTSVSRSQDRGLDIGGEIYIDHRVRTETGEWSWNENRLDLELEKRFQSKAKFYGNIWLRSFGFPFLTKTEQLFNKDAVSPYNLEIREAYVELYDFLLKRLDVKIGRQRIVWGTGDRINPTDNLNPDDLEDIWDFGRHLGSDGIRIRYYFSDFNIELDYLPFFRPAVLPRGDWADALMPPLDFPQEVVVRNITDSLSMPAYSLGESSTYGVKFGGFLAGYDFSLSYVYGRDDLPIQYYNTVSLVSPQGVIDIKSELYYPRQHVFGTDLAGAIGRVGIWGEVGVFLPDKEIVMTTNLDELGMPSMDSTVLKKEPFVKYVIGLDYTFRDGSYFNTQFFHGFVNERGKGNLNDYLMVNWEKWLFNRKLRINPLTGAFIVGDWDDIGGNYAWIYYPSITYKPNINTEISLGGRIIDGEGDNTFSLVSKKDEVYLSVKFSF